ncbi:hypothetical protein K8352_01080 [Flavobacteriaceae bacterium F89]|uniref:Uncharacterized protein n=1 Tax=Cerina litoralis TaxID=2874477 RepID=A0AAE3EQN8_9FLAO|nr:hypothetical protein [Cerina litoralis]MCG2459335.1 hypothetical protein [Cerina litoralis]
METKTKQILEPSLVSLHIETKNWIEDIHFYFDELTFLNDLIRKKIGSTTYRDQEHKDLYRNVDDMLKKLYGELLSELNAHEAYLSDLMDLKQNVNDEDYRSRHEAIERKLYALEQGLRNLKKSLFKYVRENDIGRS